MRIWFGKIPTTEKTNFVLSTKVRGIESEVYALKSAVEFHRDFTENDVYDFVFHDEDPKNAEVVTPLIFQKEYGNIFDCDYTVDPLYHVPFGTLEYVYNFMDTLKLKRPYPLNIPLELHKISGLNPRIVEGPKTFAKDVWVKNIYVNKDPINGPSISVPYGKWQVTDYANIVAEFRIFIFNKRVVDIRRYSGCFFKVPDINFVKNCIDTFVSAPIAYTLDVGILENGKNVVIECHDFFSCGLYGFDDYYAYPLMLAGWWKEFIKKQS
jgi:hypothetical protein